MIRRGAALLCLAFALLPLLPPAPTAAHRAADGQATHRVYFVYAPDQPQQRRHAIAAYNATAGLQGVAWLGVRRGAAAATMPFGTASVDDVLATPGLSDAVRDWLRRLPTADAVLVENRTDGRVVAGAGRDAARVAREAGLVLRAPSQGRVDTDVGFTTWGKVKDLFR